VFCFQVFERETRTPAFSSLQKDWERRVSAFFERIFAIRTSAPKSRKPVEIPCHGLPRLRFSAPKCNVFTDEVMPQVVIGVGFDPQKNVTNLHTGQDAAAAQAAVDAADRQVRSISAMSSKIPRQRSPYAMDRV